MNSIRQHLFMLLLGAMHSVSAHTLTNVPMQGAMIHVGFAYHAEHGGLHVHKDTGVPELLALSQMDDHSDFDPGDPWFSDLDRTQSGMAFNRQYGFVIDAESDPLPAGTAIAIRQTEASSGLRAYRYRGTDPKAWEPLFGTDGSSDTLIWNLIMFHPAYAAAIGSGPHSATYEATVVDATTGAPVEGGETVVFQLTWNVRGQSEPQLEIARKLVLSWPAAGTDHRVETAEAPEGPWTLLESPGGEIDGHWTILVDPTPGNRFYRLVPATQP